MAITAERENSSYIVTAEFEVLKCLIDYPDNDFPNLTENSFPHKTARSVYKALSILKERGERINESSLLREANKLDDQVSRGVVQTVFATQVDVSNIEGALASLQDGAIKHSLSTHLDKVLELVKSNNPISPSEIYKITSDMQEAIANVGNKTKSKTLEEALDDYDDYLDARKAGNKFIIGDEFLDSNLTRKFRGGQTITIAGATGTGKSAFSLNLVKNHINLSVPTMYFTLEMDEESTMDRLIAQELQIPVEQLYDKSNIEWIKEKKKVLRLQYANKPFRIIDQPSIDLATIHYLIREFKAIYKVDYVCVIIDLATMVKDFIDVKSGSGTLANAIEMSANLMNAIAKIENVCFINVVQFNRSADSTRIDSIDELNKLRPNLNSIKNSHALAERSRVVLSVFRPKYYAERLFPENPDVELMQDEMQIQILKQSQGSVGSIGRYLFDGPTFSIVPRSEEDIRASNTAIPGTENIDY